MHRGSPLSVFNHVRYDLRNRTVQANPMSGGTVLYSYDTSNHRVYKSAYNGGTYSAEEIYF